MIQFNPIGSTAGDCMTPYDVTGYKAKTVGEFIEEVLKEKSDEWGFFSVNSVTLCEYKDGKLHKRLSKHFLDMPIEKITSYGGWFRMDYMIVSKASLEDAPQNDRISLLINGVQYKLVESEHTVICKQQCAICEKWCNSFEDRICERLGGGKRCYFKKV